MLKFFENMKLFEKNNKQKSRTLGQTAIELAVFGSILIFVLGVIIKQTMSFAYLQNQNYKTMRWAMTNSYLHSSGLVYPTGDDGHGTSSRATTSILVLEDRLQVGGDKYTSLDRVPYMASSTATFSRNTFLGLESGEWYNLPILDVYVNGQHFPLRLGGFKTVSTAPYSGDPHVVPNCSTVKICTAEGPTPSSCSNWDESQYPCRVFFEKVPNHPEMADWCAPTSTDPSPSCPGLSVEARFDLDRDGSLFTDASYGSTFFGEVGSPDTDVPGEEAWDVSQEAFAWQWNVVAAYDQDSGYLAAFLATLWGSSPDYARGISIDKGENVMVDVDNDLKEERILSVSSSRRSGVITSVTVMDMQEGDYDVSEDSTTEGDPVGFSSDVQFYSFTKSGEGDIGTYLLLEEGELYGAENGQYVRSVQKKDQIDIIQRILRLSHNTGRFCDSNGNPVGTGSSAGWSSGTPNPVKACQDCFFQDKVALTCFDSTSTQDKQRRPVIYVRSKIQDLRGRKWVTSLSSDYDSGAHYIDFKVPTNP